MGGFLYVLVYSVRYSAYNPPTDRSKNRRYTVDVTFSAIPTAQSWYKDQNGIRRPKNELTITQNGNTLTVTEKKNTIPVKKDEDITPVENYYEIGNHTLSAISQEILTRDKALYDKWIQAHAQYPELKNNPQDYHNMKTFDINPKEGTFTITYNDGRYPYTYKIEAIQKNIKKEEPQPWQIKYTEKQFENSKQFIDYINTNKINSENVEIFDKETNKWVTIMDLGLDRSSPIGKMTNRYLNISIINQINQLKNKVINKEISPERGITESAYILLNKIPAFAINDIVMNDGIKGFAKLFGDEIPEDWNFFNELYNGMAKAWKEDMNKNGWLRFKSRIKEIVTNPY